MGVVCIQMLTDNVPSEKKGKAGIFQSGARTMENTYLHKCGGSVVTHNLMICEASFDGCTLPTSVHSFNASECHVCDLGDGDATPGIVVCSLS